jgi:hypothetical protein
MFPSMFLHAWCDQSYAAVKFTKKQTMAERVDTKNELEHGRGIEKGRQP